MNSASLCDQRHRRNYTELALHSNFFLRVCKFSACCHYLCLRVATVKQGCVPDHSCRRISSRQPSAISSRASPTLHLPTGVCLHLSRPRLSASLTGHGIFDNHDYGGIESDTAIPKVLGLLPWDSIKRSRFFLNQTGDIVFERERKKISHARL
jgi:hypothetical protein